MYFFIFPLALLGCLTAATAEGWNVGFPKDSPLVPLVHFQHKSYHLGRFNATYFEADQFCRIINMELVRVQSKEEIEALQRFFHVSDIYIWNFWTSGSKVLDDKTWVWMTTGEKVTYFKWDSGKPDTAIENSCLGLVSRLGKDFFYYNRRCHDQISFICERDNSKPQDCNDRRLSGVNVYVNNNPCPTGVKQG